MKKRSPLYDWANTDFWEGPHMRVIEKSWTITGAALCLALSAPVLAQVPAAASDPKPDLNRAILEKDMTRMLQWFDGSFDNDLQVFFEKDLNTPQEYRHGRIHSIFKRVAVPALGKDVFYVQQYSDNDPSKIYRQRVYTFTPDYAENAIRLDILTPKDGARFMDAHKDPTKLANAVSADFNALPGCEVYWRRQANQFLGTMKPKTCKIIRTGKPSLLIDDNLVLTENEIWIGDVATLEDGTYVWGNKDGVPHKLDRVRQFSCWVSLLRGAKHGDTGLEQGNESWFYQANLPIHDRGGVLAVTTDETPPRTVEFKLRRVAWPYGPNRPSTTLYVNNKGEERAVSYAWGEEMATRVGINLRWIQASCSAVN